jgi:demethylsterigmatocystin 6-O-methyltransferase
METAMNDIRNLYAKANAPERQKIQEQLRDLQDNLYTDWEVMFGLAGGVRFGIPYHLHKQLR